MNRIAFIFIFLYLIIIIHAETDSLLTTHFAIDLKVRSYDADFLQIRDKQNNSYFQGVYNADQGFEQIFILPVTTDSLYVTLGDSLKSFAIDPSTKKITVDFTPPPPSWMQRLLWLKHDLESVFPFLALVIIFIIKRNRDRKKELEESQTDTYQT